MRWLLSELTLTDLGSNEMAKTAPHNQDRKKGNCILLQLQKKTGLLMNFLPVIIIKT